MLCVAASSPALRIPSAVEHGVHDELHLSNLEEYCVRKPPEKSSTHRAVDELVGFRMASNRRETSVDGPEKLLCALVALPVVSGVRLVQIKLRLRSETKSPYLRRTSLARTSSHDFAVRGLRACARRRLASSLR